jgi:hypothetical protein
LELVQPNVDGTWRAVSEDRNGNVKVLATGFPTERDAYFWLDLNYFAERWDDSTPIIYIAH